MSVDFKKKFDFLIVAFKDAFNLVRLDMKTLAKVHDQKDIIVNGLVILVLPFLVNLILFTLTFPSGFGAIFSKFVFWPVIIPGISVFAMIYFMAYFSQNYYKVKVNINAFTGLMLYACIVFWYFVLPVFFALIGLGGLASVLNKLSVLVFVWLLFIAYKIFSVHYAMKNQPAIVTVVLGGFVYFFVMELLGKIFVGSYYNFFFF